ncbi:MAG: YfcC family protein, partial [Deltaproteobacteria bacterium]
VASQAALHLPVPSVSGQAVLTMPLLVPLSDLIGLSRQVTVLAYQYGAGLTDLLTPTNGALMAMLAACGVRYEAWLRFAAPLYAGLLALGAAGVLLGIWLGV